MFIAVRVVFIILSCICALLFIKEYKKSNWKKCVTYALILILSTICNLYPPEALLLNFSSADKAHNYVSHVDEYIVIEGKRSTLVVDTNATNFFKKTYKGYKPCYDFKVKIFTNFPMGCSDIVIYRFGNTQDYYIEIKDTAEQKDKISDNLGSTFYHIKQSDGKTYTYAHILDFDHNSYSINIDGSTYFNQ